MIWAAYGILHSLLRACLSETNREYSINPVKLAFGQTLFGMLILLPFVPMMSWPNDVHFYRGAVGASVIYSLGMLVNLILSSQKAGRVSTIYMPLEAISVALVWAYFLSGQSHAYQEDQLAKAIVVIAFIVGSISMVLMRPHDVNIRTFILAAPLGVTYALAALIAKDVMPWNMHAIPAALSFSLITFAVMSLVLGFAAFISGQLKIDILFTARAMEASVLTGLVSVCSYVSFITSLAIAPNPGYTCLLAFLLPVWLWVWHIIIGIKDKANPLATGFIIVAVALLITAEW